MVATYPLAISAHDALDGMVQDWLFLVLRYAVSREARDLQAVLDFAGKMDTLGRERNRETFRFFRSHSGRLCAAIAAPDTPARRHMLTAHACKIGRSQFEQAFLRACHLETRKKTLSEFGTSNRSELWKGLQGR
jgi:hypothetical protein